MTIYVGNDFKCYVTAADGRTSAETDFFDGKCAAYIEGYRFVPAGQTWTREDGVQFAGEMVAPWKDYAELDSAQREYERQQLADAKAALQTLGYTEGA